MIIDMDFLPRYNPYTNQLLNPVHSSDVLAKAHGTGNKFLPELRRFVNLLYQ